MNANQLAVLEAIKKLTAREMSDLVPEWNRISKMKRAQEALKVVATAELSYGDIITWKSEKRGRPFEQYVKFEKYNRAHTCFVGMECDKNGKEIPPAPGKTGKWTVAMTLMTHVNGKPVAKA